MLVRVAQIMKISMRMAMVRNKKAGVCVRISSLISTLSAAVYKLTESVHKLWVRQPGNSISRGRGIRCCIYVSILLRT